MTFSTESRQVEFENGGRHLIAELWNGQLLAKSGGKIGFDSETELIDYEKIFHAPELVLASASDGEQHGAVQFKPAVHRKNASSQIVTTTRMHSQRIG